jgi:aryl-alcohol dehydrogenase-like predicted oxidoreductase
MDLIMNSLIFGGAALSGEGRGYGFGPISENDAISLVRYSYEAGVRLFDTAPIYGFGLSEKRLAKALKNYDQAQIISKSGVGWHENLRVDMDNNPQKTQKMLEDSLRRLQRDYIDYYLIHWPDDKWDIRYPMEVLSKAKLEGKILHIGLSNTTSEDFLKAQEIDQIAMLQGECNLFTNENWEQIKDLVGANPYCCWGTLDKGILTNFSGVDKNYDETDARRSAPWWKKNDVLLKLKKVKKLAEYFQEQGYSKSEIENKILALCLNYPRSLSASTKVIVGMKNKNHVNSIIDSFKLSVSSQELTQALTILRSVP